MGGNELKKNWFNKLILSYTPVFLIITLTMILIGFLALNDLSKKEAVKANEVLVQNMIHFIDLNLRTIDQLMVKELQTDDSLKAFYNMDTEMLFPELIAYETSKKMKEIKVNSPLIDSIYYYRNSDGIILSENRMIHIDEFGDAEFVHKYLAGSIESVWTEQRLYHEFNPQYNKKVVSIVRKYPLLSTISDSSGLAVINVNVMSLQRLVKEIFNSEVSFLLLIDRDQQLIYGDGMEIKENLLPEIIQEYSRTLSEYSGLRIISGLKGDMIQGVSTISYVWLVIVFILIFIGIGWIIVATKRNYKPIGTIMTRINEYAIPQMEMKEIKDRKKYDEFKFIEMSIDTIVEKSHAYQEQYKSDIILLRQHLFFQVISGERMIKEEEWKSEMKRLALPAKYEYLIIAVVEIDKYNIFHDSYCIQDQALLKFVLSSVIQEIAETHATTVWSEWITRRQLGIMYTCQEHIQSDDLIPYRISENVCSWVRKNLSFTVSIGLGSSIDMIKKVPFSYDRALEALNFKLVLGNDRVIRQKDILSKEHGQMYMYLQAIHTIAQKFRISDPDWVTQLKVTMNKLKFEWLSQSSDLMILMNYLVSNLNHEVMELSIEYQEVWRNEAISQLNEVLKLNGTLEEIHMDLIDILVNVDKKFSFIRENNRNYKLIKNVRNYIDNHYWDSSLSLNQLSEEFGISANYVSRLFKEEFGEKFVDYLLQIRMKNAKLLLINTSSSIQEVANKIGYLSSISFIRIFKKVNAVTPGDYRQQQKNEGKHGSKTLE